jgi:hypothetical protein
MHRRRRGRGKQALPQLRAGRTILGVHDLCRHPIILGGFGALGHGRCGPSARASRPGTFGPLGRAPTPPAGQNAPSTRPAAWTRTWNQPDQARWLARKEFADFLTGQPPFDALNADDLGRLASHVEVEYFPAGTEVVGEDERLDHP